MTDGIPAGILVVRILNGLGAVLGFIVGVLMALIAVPNYLKAAENAGRLPGDTNGLLVGLLFFLIGGVPCALLLMQNGWLKSRAGGARIAQIVIGVVLLPVFPVGTVLGALMLYFMLADAGVKSYFAA